MEIIIKWLSRLLCFESRCGLLGLVLYRPRKPLWLRWVRASAGARLLRSTCPRGVLWEACWSTVAAARQSRCYSGNLSRNDFHTVALAVWVMPCLFAACFQIFKGYLDDQLNADGGWLETVVLNYHEGEGKGSQFTDDILKVKSKSWWTFLNNNLPALLFS